MSKKDITIIIVGLVILAVLILVAYFIGGKEGKEEIISVITDKEEYNSGDSLKVKIANNTEERFCFSSCHPYYIEKRDGEWVSYKYEDCPEEDKVDSCVDPKEIKAFELTIPPLEKGAHRLMIQACAGCSSNELFTKEKELFSNQFIIK